MNLYSHLLLYLEDYSAIAIATYYWNVPPIKEKVFRYYKKKHNILADDKVDKKWCDIINFVQENVKASVIVPKKCLEKLMDMIFLIGRKTFFWINHAVDKKNFELYQVVNICWTSYGSVDEGKMFQRYWQNDPNIYLYQLYRMACFYSQIDFIKKRLSDMVRIMKKITDDEGIKFSPKNCGVFGIMALYICTCTKTGFELYKKIIKALCPAKELMVVCIENDILKAAKYFYGKVEKTKKEAALFVAYSECIITNFDRSCERDNYEKEKFSESLVFLHNAVSFQKKHELNSEGNSLLKYYLAMGLYEAAIVSYPYQKVYLQFLNSVWDELKPDDRETFFKFALEYTISYPENYVLANKVFPQFLSWMLPKMNAELKFNSFVRPKTLYKTANDNDYLENLLNFNDFYCLNLIFNDGDLTHHCRGIFIKAVASFFIKNLNLNKEKFSSFDGFLNFFRVNEEFKELCRKEVQILLSFENLHNFFEKVL